MITRFRVQNFKSLADIGPVEFGPLNAIIGPNGSGKSSLLQAIDFLRAFFETSVEVYLSSHHWAYNDLPNLRKRNKVIKWEVEVEIPGPGRGAPDRYSYSVALSPRRYLGIGEERLVGPDGTPLLERRGREVKLLNRRTGNYEEINALRMPTSVMSMLDTETEAKNYPDLIKFREHVTRFRSFLLWDPKVLRQSSKGKQSELGPSGENLASVLAHLKENRPEQFERAIRRVKKLFPWVSEVSIKGGKGWGWKEIQLHEVSGVAFNSNQLSDGVLRLLAVVCLLHSDSIPPVLSLEEPENGVHPQLLRDVVQLLRELTLRKPPTTCQVFFTTHSPYVLDEFYENPEQVYLMERGKNADGAHIARLSDCSQVDLVRELFDKSLGEAWFSGVIGGCRGKA